MALNSMGLGFTFSARDMASGTFSRISRGLKKIEMDADRLQARYDKAMKGMRRGAIMALGGVAALSGINKAHKAFADFELQIVAAGKKMQATEGQMKALEKAARKAGIETQFSPKEAAAALSEMASMGASAKEGMEALMPTLKLATASMGKLGVADAARVGMVALNSYGMTVDKVGGVMNDLANIANSSAFQYNDFQIAISQAGGTAKLAGQSFRSMLASMAMLRDAGFEASRGATSYREAVRRMTGDPGALKYLKKYGVSVLDAKGNFRDFAAVVADLKPKLDQLNKTEKMNALRVIFGARGMNAYAATIASYEKLVRKGLATTGDYSAAHRRLMGVMQNNTNTLKEYNDAVTKSAWGQRMLLKGSWETLVISFGKLFNKHLLPVIKGFIDALNTMIQWIENLSPGLAGLIGKVVVFGAVLLTLVGVFKVLRGLWAMFTIGRLIGKYVAGQAAAATATTTQTAAITAQTAALRANSAAGAGGMGGRIMRGAGKAVGVAAMAYGAVQLGKAMGNWLGDKIWGKQIRAADAYMDIGKAIRYSRQEAARATDTVARLHASYEQWMAKLSKGAKTNKGYNMTMLAMTQKMGELMQIRQKLMRTWSAAVARGDHKAAAKSYGALTRVVGQIDQLKRGQMQLETDRYRKRVMMEKDLQKRRMMQNRILASDYWRFYEKESQYLSWRKTTLAAINKIEDPVQKAHMMKIFSNEDTRRKVALNAQLKAVTDLAVKYGVITGKVGGKGPMAGTALGLQGRRRDLVGSIGLSMDRARSGMMGYRGRYDTGSALSRERMLQLAKLYVQLDQAKGAGQRAALNERIQRFSPFAAMGGKMTGKQAYKISNREATFLRDLVFNMLRTQGYSKAWAQHVADEELNRLLLKRRGQQYQRMEKQQRAEEQAADLMNPYKPVPFDITGWKDEKGRPLVDVSLTVTATPDLQTQVTRQGVRGGKLQVNQVVKNAAAGGGGKAG